MPKPFAKFLVKANLPEELAVLSDLAYNLRWTWDPQTLALFRGLDPALWEEANHNPLRLLGLIRQEKLSAAVADEGFMAQLRRSCQDLEEYMHGRTWFQDAYEQMDVPKIAYFSMEFGLTECLPIYSGGLGILAGDFLKALSDSGEPAVGIGLLYQNGYLQQHLNPDGWQQERYPVNDFYTLP